MTVSAEVQSLITELKQWDEKIAGLANHFSQQSAESVHKVGQVTDDLERLRLDLANSIRRETALQQELDNQKLITANLQKAQKESQKHVDRIVQLEREKKALNATINQLQEELSSLKIRFSSSQEAVAEVVVTGPEAVASAASAASGEWIEHRPYPDSNDALEAYLSLCQKYLNDTAFLRSATCRYQPDEIGEQERIKFKYSLAAYFVIIFAKDCENSVSSQYKNTIAAIGMLPAPVDIAATLLRENEKETFGDDFSTHITQLFSCAVQMLECDQISPDGLTKIFVLVQRILADIYVESAESMAVDARIRAFQSHAMFGALQSSMSKVITCLRQRVQLEVQEEQVSGTGNLLGQIRGGVALRKVAPPAEATSAKEQASGGDDLLSQIRVGVSLRKVVKPAPASKALNFFEKALEERRRAIEGKNSAETDAEGNDGEWGDDGPAAKAPASTHCVR